MEILMLRFFNLSILAFLHIIGRSKSPIFVNNCFRHTDGSDVLVNIMFDSQLPFVPKVVELITLTLDYKDESNFKDINQRSYILRREDRRCDDPFILKVPVGQQPIQKIKMTLVYGIGKIIMDEFHVIVKQNFEENFYKVEGLLQNLQMPLVIIHDSQFKHTENERHDLDLETIWKNNVRKLLPGEKYCINLFTSDFAGIIIFSEFFPPLNPLSEYYILYIRVYKNLHTKNFLDKEYLARVYPCETSTSFYDILDFYADKDIQKVEFEFWEYYFDRITVTLQRLSKKKLKVVSASYPYNFDELEVNLSDLNQEMVDKKVGVILHRSEHDIKRCFVRVSGIFQRLEICSRVEEKVGNVVLRTYLYHIDTHAKESGIFSIRLGLASEENQCLAR